MLTQTQLRTASANQPHTNTTPGTAPIRVAAAMGSQTYNRATADAQAALLQGVPEAERLFKLGMMCSTGQSVPLDMVSAHKWFNIAAMLGMKDAVRLRNEIAAEMSSREIAAAQRAARHWLTRH
jgi:uncharacterized protein